MKNFVLGHRSGTAEQGTDRNGGKMKAGCLGFWELVEGNFMCLKLVNLIILIDTDPDQIKLNSRLLFTVMRHSLPMYFYIEKKNDNRK